MRLLVFLPCLNEEETLAQVLGKIPTSVPGTTSVHRLVVDDGSTDRSAEVARQAGATVISHGSNRGVGQSMQTALGYALRENFDILVNIDADGQFDPEDIPRLVAPIVSGKYEFVAGSRFMEGGKIHHMSAVKRWGNTQMTRLVGRLAHQSFSDVSCGFRAYSKEAMYRLNLYGRFTYTQETFLSLAFQNVSILQIPIKVRYFKDRQSRVAGNLLSYTFKTLNILLQTYRDHRPLRFFSGIAGLFFAAGGSFLTFLGYWWLTTGHFSPHIWSGFVGAAFVFSGLTFLVLGLLADMLSRGQKNQELILYLLRRGQHSR